MTKTQNKHIFFLVAALILYTIVSTLALGWGGLFLGLLATATITACMLVHINLRYWLSNRNKDEAKDG